MITKKKSIGTAFLITCLCLLFTVAMNFTGFAQTDQEYQLYQKLEIKRKAESDNKKQENVQAEIEKDIEKEKDIEIEKESEKEKDIEKEKESAETESEKDVKKTQEKEIVEQERDLMEKALELLDMADSCWKKGDIEDALNNLDKAYALVLDTNGDIEIARQKDDLRLLISKRILALYSTQNTKTNGKASEIQYLYNDDVEKEIKSFQTVERDFFIASYKRSALYSKIIIDELKKAGIPEELFWLPLVESGFKVTALSSARALGLWQFIPSTGYKYGLSRDEWMDERMDVLKSTEAAIAYLKELHGMFGDWLTVLAAYNCGEGRVLRVISRQRINYFDRFWDLYRQLPHETARYVPRFLATLHIVKDPAKYGFDLEKETQAALDYEIVKINKMMKLSDVASKLEVSEDVINVLNAELRYKVTPNREYEFKIPKDLLQKFNVVYADIPQTQRPYYTYKRTSYVRHRVRWGETVSSIAKRYKVSTRAIYNHNHLSKSGFLRQGQIIRIPVYRSGVVGSSNKSSVGKSTSHVTYSGSVKTYKIKQGDSLTSIAKKHNVSIEQIKQINHMKSNSIQAGKTLKVPAEQPNGPSSAVLEGKVKRAELKTKIESKTLTPEEIAQLGTNKHIVTRGDNLSTIARKYHVELAKIMEWNKISNDDHLMPGQILIVQQ